MIKKSDLLIKERKLAAQGLNLALVLVHDLLLNKNGIVSNTGPFKDAILRHKTRLNAEWIKAKIRLKVSTHISLAKVDTTFIPRWARINTLRISKEDFMRTFSHFTIVRDLDMLQQDCIYEDEHIEHLLAFHPQQNLTNHKYYLNGSLIFQNKASCIPAAVLDAPLESTVIDACAAPGNKTSHLAALLCGTGKVLAFERDNKRVNVLRKMLTTANASVEVLHQDFTRTDPFDDKYAEVTHLLLDPSCSGSGIVNRLDYLTNSPAPSIQEHDLPAPEDRSRLDSLAKFQLALLLHAMKFPKARKISYSTCSIHAVENEGVVMAALAQSPDWTVSSRSDTLPNWPYRGRLEACDDRKDISEGLIRAEPGRLGTIGFFVACFVRRQHGETHAGPANARKRDGAALFLEDSHEDDDGFRGNRDESMTGATATAAENAASVLNTNHNSQSEDTAIRTVALIANTTKKKRKKKR